MSPMADLLTDRLELRRWRTTDRVPFARMNADLRVMEHFPALLTPADSTVMSERIQAHFDHYGFGLWAAELRATGHFIGFIGLNVPAFDPPFTSRTNPCVEIGWRLAFDYWGGGLATEGARAVFHHAFTALAIEEIVAFTVPANHRSRRVMEKLGMTHNPADDFDHPRLEEGHPLRRHVLYRVQTVSHKPKASSQ
jgi:RimJ/RimL family protein N-acetyltransferase